MQKRKTDCTFRYSDYSASTLICTIRALPWAYSGDAVTHDESVARKHYIFVPARARRRLVTTFWGVAALRQTAPFAVPGIVQFIICRFWNLCHNQATGSEQVHLCRDILTPWGGSSSVNLDARLPPPFRIRIMARSLCFDIVL